MTLFDYWAFIINFKCKHWGYVHGIKSENNNSFHVLVSLLIFKTCICLVQVNLFCVLLGLSSTLPIIIYIYYTANSWLFLIKGETPFDTLERHKHSWVFKILSFSVNSGCTSASSWAILSSCFKCHTSSPADCKIESALCWLSSTAHVWQNLYQMSKFFFQGSIYQVFVRKLWHYQLFNHCERSMAVVWIQD